MASTPKPRGEDYARAILVTIREARKEHHACTAREIGRRMGVSHVTINGQLTRLKRAGLVDFTKLPGGIWLTDKGGKVASGGRLPTLPAGTKPGADDS